jgi:hypothetical protein
MTYVEWLRVRAALKWTAIVLGALLVLEIALRLVLVATGHDDALAFVHGMQTDPGSHVVTTTLPDGTQRTTIDNAKHDVNVVIDDNGYSGKRITITSLHGDSDTPKSVTMGSVDVRSSLDGHKTITTVETDQPETFFLHAAIATAITLIVATILAAPFARENDGHLEIALTKPIGRVSLALKLIGVDLLGLLGVWVLSLIFLIAAHTVFQQPRFVFAPNDAAAILLGWLGITAWYAFLCAATASMRRGFGLVLGLIPLASFIIVPLAKAKLGDSQVAQMIHWIVTPLAVINPFYYLHFGVPATVDGRPVGAAAVLPQYELPALAILAIVYLTLAVLQWRRVEA